MKKIIACFVLVLLVSNIINAQVPKKGNYRLKTTTPLSSISTSISDSKISDSTKVSPIINDSKIEILNIDSNDVIYYRYWNFKDSAYSAAYNGKVFSISTSEFEKNSTPYYPNYKGANVGVYTVPFRLRGIGKGNFDFESSLSLQANLVFGFGTTHSPESWCDVSLGIGLTGANLNNKNSDTKEARTASAFTLSFGGVFKPAKFANIGIFIGWDFLGNNDKSDNWVYNKKTWLGLGINVSFHEITTSNTGKSRTQ